MLPHDRGRPTVGPTWNIPFACFYSLNKNDTQPAYRSATVSIVSAHGFSTG